MRLVSTILRAVLALALVAIAGVCIVRGMRDLFWGPPPPGVSAAQQAASFGGVTSAMLYFVGGVLALIAAGEISPKPAPRAEREPTIPGGSA